MSFYNSLKPLLMWLWLSSCEMKDLILRISEQEITNVTFSRWETGKEIVQEFVSHLSCTENKRSILALTEADDSHFHQQESLKKVKWKKFQNRLHVMNGREPNSKLNVLLFGLKPCFPFWERKFLSNMIHYVLVVIFCLFDESWIFYS